MSLENQLIRERMYAMYGENRQLPEIPPDAPSVRCENGTFVGRRQENVAVFRGIPFARPPVGPLRWRRPEPPEAGGGVYEAVYNGKTPIQTEWKTEVASYYPQGEDCLYLNVWASESVKGSGRPVMVFFHGGSYGWGGTADPMYDGFHFARNQEDIVLVTAGYRTGLMGFVDFSEVPGGESYPDAPNLGILDQIEALRWVRRNIAAFGGDPENVTIFGESAGGGSVSLLPLIPEARGLFRRVIAESGSVALTFSREECQDFTRRLLETSKCRSMEELAALSEDELKEINEKVNYYNNFPQRDGRIIPLDPYAGYADGTTAGIDMILGTNQNETNYWVGELNGILLFSLGVPVKYENDLRTLKPEDQVRADTFLKETRNRIPHKLWRRVEFYNEMMFRLPAVRQAESQARSGGRVYMYYWTEPSALRYCGACHAVELAYVFGNVDETIYTGRRADPGLSASVQAMWANFARTGDPGLPDLEWPRYDEDQRPTMVLCREPHVEKDILKTQRETLFPLLDYWINPSYATMDYRVPFVRKLFAGMGGILLFLIALIILIIIY